MCRRSIEKCVNRQHWKDYLIGSIEKRVNRQHWKDYLIGSIEKRVNRQHWRDVAPPAGLETARQTLAPTSAAA